MHLVVAHPTAGPPIAGLATAGQQVAGFATPGQQVAGFATAGQQVAISVQVRPSSFATYMTDNGK